MSASTFSLVHIEQKMVASVGIEPTTPRFSVLCSANWAMKPNWRFRRELNPRSLAWQASVITATPRNHIGCGSWIWTNNLWVMSPASYQIAPFRDMNLLKWRRKRDSNPCADFSTSRFSRPVPSTRLGYSSTKIWCPRPESNRYELLHSQDFKSCASTYSATKAHLVSRWGFEPQTPWLKVKCSTGWASETYNKKIGCLGWIRTSGMQESKSCALPLGYEAKFQVVERGGFEPPNPKEQIYSLPRLASSLSLQLVVPKTGIEPVTYWLQVSCSTNWAISAQT